MAKESGKPIKVVIAIISALFDTMAGSILDGEKISITSLGSFCLKVRKQHKGHDPHRNVPIIIPESMSLKFEVPPPPCSIRLRRGMPRWRKKKCRQ